MNKLFQFRIFGKTVRFTSIFDNIEEYQFGGLSSTTVTKNNKQKTVTIDNRYCYKKIGLGFYIRKGTGVKRILEGQNTNYPGIPINIEWIKEDIKKTEPPIEHFLKT